MGSISTKIEELERCIDFFTEELESITNNFNKSKYTLEEVLGYYIRRYNQMKKVKLYNKISFNKNINIEYQNAKNIYIEKGKRYESFIRAMKNVTTYESIPELKLDITRPFYKLVLDKDKEPIILLVDLERELDNGIKSFRIIGIDEISKSKKEIMEGYLEAHIHLINQYSKGIVAFLSKIDIKRSYRRGRGTLIMKYLEEEVIGVIDKYMKNYYRESGYPESYGSIKRIDGYIASISTSTVAENINFYNSLGYTVIKKNMSKEIEVN